MLKDSVIIGQISEDSKCTDVGLRLPRSKYFTVNGVKFLNFNKLHCTAIRSCTFCKSRQGGFQTRFQNIEFHNVYSKIVWDWQHEGWFEDLDGSLSGKSAGYSVLPQNPNLPPEHCTFYESEFGDRRFSGAVCDETVKLHRFAFNNAEPSTLQMKTVLFEKPMRNKFGTFQNERITHSDGWMVTLIDGETYNMVFENAEQISNFTYKGRLDDFRDSDFVILGHNLTQVVDGVSVRGIVTNQSEHALTYHGNQFGDWFLEKTQEKGHALSYLVSGKGLYNHTDLEISFSMYHCYFASCGIKAPPPPTKKPTDAPIQEHKIAILHWSNRQTWKDAPAGWGGNYGKRMYGLPKDGDNVMIQAGNHVFADTDLPVMNKLYIDGTLEFVDTRDYNLTVTYIIIRGGRLIIGHNESHGFQHTVRIILQGDIYTPEIRMQVGQNVGMRSQTGPNVASKAIGVFGELDLHGKYHKTHWTHLATTVYPDNGTRITVMDDADWEVGDEIVVATTSFETWHTETFKIEEVVNVRTFVLNATFKHKHIAEEYTVSDGNVSRTYTMRAEVGLLTRNIKIEGGYYKNLYKHGFGGRVIVGNYLPYPRTKFGSAQLSNVEFIHTGQEGFTDDDDPRYSIVFMTVKPCHRSYFKGCVSRHSYVKGCSFHHGFNTAIGLNDSRWVDVVDNVVHITIGSAMMDLGTRNRWVHNLVTVSIFAKTPGSQKAAEFNGGFDLEYASNPTLVNNSVAGSERVGYKVKGQRCSEDRFESWSGNVAHGTLHGVYMFKKSISSVCSKIAGFKLYKNYDFGIYIQVACSIIITDVTLIDNRAGIVPLIVGPSARLHKTSKQYVRIENTLIVGMSPGFVCDLDSRYPGSSFGTRKQRGPTATSSYRHARLEGMLC
ncbi:fibrocystin-L-like [Amphiura filiformis]|uniref:fibrocystin-L-like n=1 Tax=Amphiura filiformis TaxID=82378 RepID=UPI003B220022